MWQAGQNDSMASSVRPPFCCLWFMDVAWILFVRALYEWHKRKEKTPRSLMPWVIHVNLICSHATIKSFHESKGIHNGWIPLGCSGWIWSLMNGLSYFIQLCYPGSSQTAQFVTSVGAWPWIISMSQNWTDTSKRCHSLDDRLKRLKYTPFII